MNWFWIALITPLAHAAVNHIDKHLISKYLKGGEVGSLVLFSALFAVFALPIIAIIDHGVFSINGRDVVILMINGGLLVLAYICYFYALAKDEASFVAPLFQMVPVLGFILGYAILGETLTLFEIIGSLIVICGAIILSLDLSEGAVGLKKTVILFMFGSSALYAINGILFKFVAETQQRFWPSLFWDFLGKVAFGILIFMFIGSYRRQFIAVLKENRFSILALNSLNEVLAIFGEGALVFATLLAPVVLVQVVSGFQPMFVFIYGVILTLFFPSLGKESLSKKHILQKIVGVFVIMGGSILINI